MKNKLLFLLVCIIVIFYSPFFFRGHIPLPADTLVGSYFPWLDYKWDYPVGVPVKNPPISDAFSQFFPWKYLSIDLLKQGIAPLWNPYEFAGTPLLASFHTAPFFPANLILFLPRPVSWGIYIFSSSFIAALFMYLFLANHTKNKLSSLTGSIIFAFAGPMTTWVEFGTGVFAAAFLPLCLYFADKFKQTLSKKYLIFLSLSFASLILAGHAQIIIYSLVIIPAYVLLVWKKIGKQPLFVFAALLLGVGLSSFQTLPTYDFLSTSIRSSEQYAADFNFGLTPVKEAVRIIAPDFFGSPVTYNHYSQTGFYHEFASFIGTLSLPLILALFFTKNKNKYEKLFMFIFITSLILGIENPLSKLFYSLPLPLITYSYASRIFFIATLSAAALVTFSLSRLNINRLSTKKIIIFSLISILWILLSLLLAPKQHQMVSVRNSIIPLSLLVVAMALLLTKVNKKIIVLAISALLILDLYRFFSKHNPFVPSHIIFPSTKTIEFLQNQQSPFRIATIGNTIFPPNSWVYYHLESIEGYNPLRTLSYNRLFNLVNGKQYFSKSGRFSDLESSYNPLYLRSLNTRFLLGLDVTAVGINQSNTEKFAASGYLPVFQDKTVVVYENKSALPRAYFIPQTTFVQNEQELAQIMQEPSFDPTKTAVLLQNPATNLEYDPASKVEVVSHQSNKVILKTSASTQNLLILADAYDKGWQAELDGNKTKIYLTNAALRGVIVPAGDHTIEFIYSPSSFKYGLIISSLSLGLLLFLPLIYKIFLHHAFKKN